MDQNELKKQAAAEALIHVKNGMVLGLGSGSTAAEFVKLLGEKIKAGELGGIVGIPTSEATAKLAEEVGVELSTLNKHDKIDLAVDGADEVDGDLNLIKGLGKALLREKVTEIHAEKFVVVVDQTKVVEKLGTKGPLPVEIVKFAHESTIRWLNSIKGCRAEHWLEDDGTPAETDNGNFLAKLWFEGGIEDAEELAGMLEKRAGVVEHGLFLNMASAVIVAEEDGIKVLD